MDDQVEGEVGMDLSSPSDAHAQEQLLKLWQWMSSTEWLWRVVIYGLLVAPLVVSGPIPKSDAPLNVSWPRVHSGDEPHYLLILNSVIEDGDVDLSNNYSSALAGGSDAGLSYAGYALDRHVSWYQNGKIVYWWDVFEEQPWKWKKDDSGVPIPTRRKGQEDAYVPACEYPTHPPGLAFLLAPVTYLFRGTAAVESIALICTALVVVLGSLFFERLISPYTNGWQQRLFIVAVAFLGTPVWHYARTLFVEPYMLCLALGAYAGVLRSKQYFWPGVCIAIGVWMKPPFVLLAVPLGLICLSESNFRSLLKLSIPVVLSVIGVLAANRYMHGSIFATTIAWRSGNPLRGTLGIMFSPVHGVVTFSPVAIIAIMLIPEFFKRSLRDCVAIGLGFLLYLFPVALYFTWHGGFCYGPRMIIPVLPFLYVPLCCFFSSPRFNSAYARGSAAFLVVCSILFNAIGAFGCGWFWSQHPAKFLIEAISAST